MGNRLTSITTRTGDAGDTAVADGTRVPKDNARIAAIGDVDELNSFIGLLASQVTGVEYRNLLGQLQNDLFDLGGSLAMGECTLEAGHVERLERALELYNADLPPLKEFILPGGTQTASVCHVARAVCRRAERSMVTLHRTQPLDPRLLQYINRLSDLLFVLARVLARSESGEETYWRSDRLHDET